MAEQEALLDGVRVVDLAGEPAAIAGRILADFGADVIVVEPPHGSPMRQLPYGWAAWRAGTRSIVMSGPEDPQLDRLLVDADIVIDTPGFPEAWIVDESRAPGSVWVHVTPFGSDGPRANWRASDLGVMAGSGNLWGTGYPDRSPVRCVYPTSYAHGGGEAVMAALSALWVNDGSGRVVDCSLQETVFAAQLGGIAEFAKSGERGRRTGAWIGHTREVWGTRDGFATLGLRGGPVRLKHWTKITEILVAEDIPGHEAMVSTDWLTFDETKTSETELNALYAALGEWLSRHTNRELFDLACEFSLFLAPVMSPREMFEDPQLEARAFLAPLDKFARFPQRLAVASSVDSVAAPLVVRAPAPELGPSNTTWSPRSTPSYPDVPTGRRAWSNVNILEFGSGAAGPISTRYFAEHGATVLRIESTTRPTFSE